MKRNIKVVNINDIEDIILTKHELDLKMIADGTIEKKMTIEDFFHKYATPTHTYAIHGKQISFNIHELYDTTYIFICDGDEEKISLLLNKLKTIKYDLNNLKEMAFKELLEMGGIDQTDVFVIGTKYYK